MTKIYIFYTTEGFTQDLNKNDIENCQVLGWANGSNEKDAFDNFRKENSSINFRNICCQKLASDKTYYF